MRVMKKIFSILLVLAAFCSACEKDTDADDVVIFVTPSATTAVGGQKIYFDITSQTINSYVRLLEVESFDSVNGEQLLYSEEFSAKSISERYIYDVPNIDAANLEVELTFTAEDNLGNRQWMRHKIQITSDSKGLDELTGITLYSPFSNKEDAFSFRLMQKIKSREAQEGDVDIFVKADSLNTSTLCRSWGSETGLRFCRTNSFNYASASQFAIESVYNNSVTSATITELEIDDIILVGDDEGAIAAIRIVNIYDDEGSERDRYDISMKTPRAGDEDSDATTPDEGDDVVEEEEEVTE